MEPEVIRSKEEMREWSRAVRSRGMTIGFVPTMGYLHEGHVALVREAQSLSDIVVVSIYVNPAQFTPSEDLETYPSDFPADLRKLAGIAAAVFSPIDVYDRRSSVGGGKGGGDVVSCLEKSGSGHETWVRVERLEKGLCGVTRPVFFRGVATIVAKLLNIVEPDFAVFGKKDYQQFKIITKMVRDLDFPVRIVGYEIVRDSDGLAMSSRNVRLSPEERNRALSINRSLSRAKRAAEKEGRAKCRELRDLVAKEIQEAGGRVDYAEIVDQESLESVEEIKNPAVFCVAAWFGNVRLLDNMEINSKTL